MIKEIVTALENATHISIVPFYTDELKECIVYEWTPRSNNGSMAVSQLMVNIKCKTMARAETLAGLVNGALLKKGDGSPVEGLCSCEQNGGGTLKDSATGYINYILYFDLIYKS